MKARASILFLSFMCFINTFGQYTEISEVLSPSTRKQLGTLGIVDINSSLEIRLRKDSLLLKCGTKISSNPLLGQKIEQLNKLLKFEKDIMQSLKVNLTGATMAEKISKLGTFSDNMDQFIDSLRTYPEIATMVSGYYDDYYALNSAVKKNYGESVYIYIFDRLHGYLAQTVQEMVENMDREKVRIQLAAFLQTRGESNRKVHIDNFDSYSAGEFYEVERWVTSFSQEDVAAFSRTQKLANDLNVLVDGNKEELWKLAKANLSSADCVRDIVSKLEDLQERRDEIFHQDVETAAAALSKIRAKCNGLLDLILRITSPEQQSDAVSILEVFNTSMTSFKTQAKALPDSIKKIFDGLPSQLASVTEIKALKEKIDNCLPKVANDVKNLEGIADAMWNVLTAKRAVASADKIGTEVYSLGINDLPEKGFIDLKMTGKRENGDKLDILVVMKTREDSINKRPGVIIEQQRLTLQQIGVYSISKVSLILASPYNYGDNMNLTKTFQFAPAGSLLFKWGSRKYNWVNFVSPGVGFCLSTPDFDLDGSPDVGIGGIVTVLKDIVSVGWSYNTNTDNPYWFFGITFPFSMPGLPINTVQTAAGR